MLKRPDVIYYSRALIGFLVGLCSAVLSGLSLLPLPWLPGLILAVAIYAITYKALKSLVGLRKREAAFLGIEAYVLMWLFSWTLFYTLLGYWA